MTSAPLLLLHAAASSAAQWKGVTRALGGSLRGIAPDLYGDGRSPGIFPPPGGSLLQVELDLLYSVVSEFGGRAHLVGHSYGALLALRMALKYPHVVESVVAIEPIAFDLLANEGPEDEAREIEQLRRTCESCVGAGELDAAAERFVDYWAGPNAYKAIPVAHRPAVAASMKKVAFGWREITTTKVDYRSVTCPVTLVHAGEGPRSTRWIAGALCARLPRAREVEVAGAGHLAPVTHPEAIARVIEGHLQWRPSRGSMRVQTDLNSACTLNGVSGG